MSDAYIQIQPDSTGKKLDTEELTVSGQTVQRERVQIAGAAAADVAEVKSTTPGGGESALVTRPIIATPLDVRIAAGQPAIDVYSAGQGVGPLTDSQLRAADVNVKLNSQGQYIDVLSAGTGSPPLTDTQLRASPVPVTDAGQQTDALTDTQLRANPVTVNGTGQNGEVIIAGPYNWPATATAMVGATAANTAGQQQTIASSQTLNVVHINVTNLGANAGQCVIQIAGQDQLWSPVLQVNESWSFTPPLPIAFGGGYGIVFHDGAANTAFQLSALWFL